MNPSGRIEREKYFHNRIFKDNRRNRVSKFYSIAKTSRNLFLNKLLTNCPKKRVLEYGCGPGTYSFKLAEAGANVIGIDISEIAIKQAKEAAKAKRVTDRTSFHVMNAEELQFDDNSFDMVCGVSILHHLNLNNALKEIARVLKNTSNAFFIEPLGHNIFINLYRRLTPHLRSKDEHPLLKSDLTLINSNFGSTNLYFFHLTSLLAVPFHNTKHFDAILSTFDFIDRTLFMIPFFRWQAWQVVIELTL